MSGEHEGFRWDLTPSKGSVPHTDPESDVDAGPPTQAMDVVDAGVPTEAVVIAVPETESSTAGPVSTEPADTEPANTEPVSTEPVRTEPVSTEPVAPRPVPRSVFPLPPPTPADGPLPVFVLPSYSIPFDASLHGVTEALVVNPIGLPDPVDESVEVSGIDLLFGEERFADPHQTATRRSRASGAERSGSERSGSHHPDSRVPGPEVLGSQPRGSRAISSRVRSVEASNSQDLSSRALSPQDLSSQASSSQDLSSQTPGLPPYGSHAAAGWVPSSRGIPSGHTGPRTQTVLAATAGILVVFLALIALFLLGMRISEQTPTSEPAAAVIAPASGAAAGATAGVGLGFGVGPG